MLSLLRQGGIVQAIMGGIVVLIIAAFAVDYRTAGARDIECAVQVYDTCVNAKEYNAAFRLSLNRGLSDDEVRRQKLHDKTQNALVERQLLLREAGRLGLSISDDALDQELLTGLARFSVPADDYLRGARMMAMSVKDPKTGRLEWQMYKRFLANVTRMNTKEFKEFQRDEIVAARMRDFIVGQTRVSDAEAFAAYDYAKSTATASVVRLATDWFARFGVERSDAATQKYADAHKEDLHAQWEKEKANWKPGCLLVSEIAAEVVTSEDKEEQRTRIDEAKKALDDKQPFALVATHFGTGDRGIAGGYVGCLGDNYGKGAKELLEAAAKLKPGKPSAVIETPRGFHILLVHGTLVAGEEEKQATAAFARVPATRAAAQVKAATVAQRLIQEGGKATDFSAFVTQLASEAVLPQGLEGKALEAWRAVAMEDEDAPSVDESSSFPRAGSPLHDAKEMGDGTGSAVFALAKEGDFVAKPVETRGGIAVVRLLKKDLMTREAFDKDEQKNEFLEALRLTKGGEELSHYVARLRAASEAHVKLNPKYSSQASETPTEPAEPADQDG